MMMMMNMTMMMMMVMMIMVMMGMMAVTMLVMVMAILLMFVATPTTKTTAMMMMMMVVVMVIYDKGPRVFAARSLVYHDCTCTRYGRFNFLGYQTVRRAAGSFITLRSAWQSRPLVFFLGSTCEVLLDVAVSAHLTRSFEETPGDTRELSASSSLHLCGLCLCAAEVIIIFSEWTACP